MLKLFRFLVLFALIAAVLSASKRPPKRRNDVPKRILDMKTESSINVQLVRTRTVEIGFSFIQGAEGFVLSAKEWIDGSFEQSVETDRQVLNVQRRSAVLRNLIPGREYLIQVQALGKTRRPFGAIQERIVRTAQMCYVCNGVETNDECSAERDAIECPHDKDACINVVRHDNNQMSITKRCAQYDPSLTEKTQTDACTGRENPNGKDSVCRCMCRSNLCNNLMMPCVDECLDDLPVPLRSTLKCSNGQKLGSVCKWECPTGYILKGLKESKCRNDRTWSVMSPPQCAPKPSPRPNSPRTNSPRPRRPRRPRTGVQARTCKPLRLNLGIDVKCTNGAKKNSVCTVTCIEGFTMVQGSTTRVCRNTKWTGANIICKEILCPAVETTSGLMNCSDSTKVGSVCNFATPSTITCQNDGSWSPSGECLEMETGRHDVVSRFSGCELLQTPAYGDIKCSDENSEGSLCKYSCANGYVMVGETQLRRCRKGLWTGSPVTCKEMKCGELTSESFVERVVKCSDDDRMGSVCDVVTPSQVTCQADGSWSMPFKQADKCKECKCP